MYESCRRLGYRYILDIANHPIGNFFEIIDHPYSAIINTNKDNINLEIFHSSNLIDNYIITNLKDKKYIYFMAHCGLYVYNTPLSEECKNYIKKILTPKMEFLNFINKNMPVSPYNIIHYRLGDEALLRENKSNIDIAYTSIQHHGEPGDILLSDSTYFKDYIKINLPDKFTILNTKQGHIGRCTDMAIIRDTLFEFIVATRANRIKTYSIYSWISGFVHIISYIYDIPIISLKLI